jgi:hypothetical protein
MFNSFWKVLPILTVGLGVSASAQNIAAQPKTVKPQPTMQTGMPCGIVENDNCFARGCANAKGWAVEFDFLYWRAENTGFPFAYVIKDVLSTAASGVPQYVHHSGSFLRLPAKWAPGFKLGTGWNTDFDRWDVFANWTWFRDHVIKSRHYNTSPNTAAPGTARVGFVTLFPQGQQYGGIVPAWGAVKASWHMWHNACDLELGRAFYLTKALSLRPHWGLRGAQLNQKFKISTTNPSITGATLPVQLDFHGKNNFWGVGPRLGVESKWHIANSNWSVLGKASGALILGQTKTRQIEQQLSIFPTAAPLNEFLTLRDLKDNFSQMVPNVQLFLGLDWGSCVNCDKWYIGINAGYEADYYWNQFGLKSGQWESFNINPTTSNGAVSMSGLTVSGHLDF